MEKKIPKYLVFNLIKNNFDFDQIKIMYYLNLLYKDNDLNPFNEDFINFSGDDEEGDESKKN